MKLCYMKRMGRTLMLAILVGITGCTITAYGEAPMPNQPSTNLCIGRLLVELPDGAEVKISTNFQRMESLKTARVYDFNDLEQELTQRADKLRATRMVRSPEDDKSWRIMGYDPDKLYANTQLVGFDVDTASGQAVLGYQPDPASVDLVTELHKVTGQRDHIFIVKGAGADEYANLRKALLTSGTQFQPLAFGEVPRAPGFCVEDGMFTDAGKPPIRESFTLVVTLPDHPDVRFVIDASAIDQVDKDEPSLKHRVDSELGILRASLSHVEVIERGKLAAAGQDGYQIAVSALYDVVPDTRMRKFFWSADGVPNDVTRPFMEIDMTVQPTEEGRNTITTDAQAKELWQQLMQGVRIRPGAV